jgi:hypothetical protein
LGGDTPKGDIPISSCTLRSVPAVLRCVPPDGRGSRSAALEGGYVRGSPSDESARLRSANRGPWLAEGSPVAGSASRRSEGAMRPAIARCHSPGTSLMALAAGRAGGGAAEGRGVRAELSGREVKRRLAGASQVERRSERPPSEAEPYSAPVRSSRRGRRRRRIRGPRRSLTGDIPRGDIPISSYTLRSVPPPSVQECPRPPHFGVIASIVLR